MPIKTKFVSGAVMADTGLGPRQIRVRASSGAEDMAGDVLLPAGCQLRGRDVPVLLDHDARIESIVGRAVVSVTGDAVEAIVTFLDEGLSSKADDACLKYKSGIATDVSVGFEPVEADRTSTGFRFKSWLLLELSLVAIGCNPDAVTTEKTAAPEPPADEPLSSAAKGPPMIEPKAVAPFTLKLKGRTRLAKDLYDVASLASMVNSFSWLQTNVLYEAEYEGDNSPVPAQLAAILSAMGDALIAMTAEEVAELLAKVEASTVKSKFSALVEKAYADRPRRAKAGKVLSRANADTLKSGHDHLEKGMECIKSLLSLVDEPGDEDDGADEDDAEDPAPEPAKSASVLTKDQRQRRARALALMVG